MFDGFIKCWLARHGFRSNHSYWYKLVGYGEVRVRIYKGQAKVMSVTADGGFSRVVGKAAVLEELERLICQAERICVREVARVGR